MALLYPIINPTVFARFFCSLILRASNDPINKVSAAVWLQLHASLVHVSACSSAVSQASDLALLVGYVA